MSAVTQYVPQVAPPLPREEFTSFVGLHYESAGLGPEHLVPAEPEFSDWQDIGDHRRCRVSYSVEPLERVTAWLLLPNGPAGVRHPLVMALHPTHHLGKDTVLGLYPDAPPSPAEAERRSWRSYGIDLVRRGYAVFAPDAPGFGERRPNVGPGETDAMVGLRMAQIAHKLRHPDALTQLGKNLWDLRRALDFLTQLDFVDPKRIGAIGHSLGAAHSVLLAALENHHGSRRVRAIVSNAGTGLHFNPRLFAEPNYLRARLNDGTLRGHERTNAVLMLVAPTPLLVIHGMNDPGYRPRDELSWPDAVRTVNDFYLAQRAGPSRLSVYTHADGHSFMSPARSLAYAWLDRHLVGQ